MSRRTRACLTCDRRTRHDDRSCAYCRRIRIGHISIGPTRWILLPDATSDLHAPTVADLQAGIDVTCYLEPA